MHEVVISDTGPLISLEKISGGFAFLRKMANHVLISVVEACLSSAIRNGCRIRKVCCPTWA